MLDFERLVIFHISVEDIVPIIQQPLRKSTIQSHISLISKGLTWLPGYRDRPETKLQSVDNLLTAGIFFQTVGPTLSSYNFILAKEIFVLTLLCKNYDNLSNY